MKSLFARILTLLVPVTPSVVADDWRADPVESRAGIHVVSNFGDEEVFFSTEISAQAIRRALQLVDWEEGFHAVTVVLTPGVSMDVSGSLDPQHGLSAMYRNRHEHREAVIREAPESVEQMEAILLAFIEPGDGWKDKWTFDFAEVPIRD